MAQWFSDYIKPFKLRLQPANWCSFPTYLVSISSDLIPLSGHWRQQRTVSSAPDGWLWVTALYPERTLGRSTGDFYAGYQSNSQHQPPPSLPRSRAESDTRNCHPLTFVCFYLFVINWLGLWLGLPLICFPFTTLNGPVALCFCSRVNPHLERYCPVWKMTKTV